MYNPLECALMSCMKRLFIYQFARVFFLFADDSECTRYCGALVWNNEKLIYYSEK